jgi:hypothetical protein
MTSDLPHLMQHTCLTVYSRTLDQFMEVDQFNIAKAQSLEEGKSAEYGDSISVTSIIAQAAM